MSKKRRTHERTPGRFNTTDFSDAVPVRWSASLAPSVRGFNCLYPRFTTYFKEQVPAEERSHVSRCWLLINNGHLVAYITLRMDSMRFRDEKGMEKKVSTGDGDLVGPPAVRIGLLASDLRARKAGRALVEWAIDHIAKEIAPKIGVRFLLVDAYYDKNREDENGESDPWDSSKVYSELGFQYVNPHETLPPKEASRSMFFDLKPLLD